MHQVTAFAPGKVILFGEHAVVYNRPAIAVPVTQVQAQATIIPEPGYEPARVIIQSPNIGLDNDLKDLSEQHPLKIAILGVARLLGVDVIPACTLRINSTIPVASGLGSGAAVSVAIIRAFSDFLGSPFTDEQVNALAYEVEKIHHLTPSGIDNSVITYAKPIYFLKGQPIQTFHVSKPLMILIGDTRITSPTALTVGEVRQGWEADQETYEKIFNAIGEIAANARAAIEMGALDVLGDLMNQNHERLRQINVSSPELERIISAALQAGALGAKLSGSGRGGNMIALVTEKNAEKVSCTLRSAGAMRTVLTQVG